MKTFSLMNSYLRHIRIQHHCEQLDELPCDQIENNPGDENCGDENAADNRNPVDENIPDDENDGNADVLENVMGEEEDYFENFDEDALKALAVSLLFKLRASFLPFSAIQHVMNGMKTMFQDMLSSLKHNMLSLLTNHGVDKDAEDVQELCGKFSRFENPFSGIETSEQQTNYMKENLKLVVPTEIALGTRIDQQVDRRSGQIIQKVVTETFQYIPVLEVLKLILNNQAITELIDSEAHCTEGFLEGYQDGKQYRQLGIFKEYPNALRFQLFYDDVEVCNPIGSKAGIHKLGMFYYSIQNFPKHLNSAMQNIHLLAVCFAADLKKYGFDPILQPFIREMKQLESDEGVHVQLDDRIVKIHGSLVSFSGDSLAAHDLLGFMSPSANRLCRLCKATREDIQVHFLEDDFEQRTPDDHDECAEDALQRQRGDPFSGVRRPCPLNVLRSFHCVTNYNMDIMHDMLEGVCPYEIKLVLHQLILIDRFITLNELNQRLKSFHYSFIDRKNKPSAVLPERLRNITDHKLGQKASQMWCLIRMLPLLIGDRIPHDNVYYKLVLLLLQCMDIIYAPVVAVSHTVYLKHLICDHHNHFASIFPQNRMINKQHHMVHYPNCIRMCGPLTSMQCLKYEMKHAFSKKLATINCNFKNICKSAACKHQIWQCIVWSGNGLMPDFECLGGTMTAIESLEGKDAIADKLQCDENSDVFVASQVSLCGTEYKPNLYLIVDVDDSTSQLQFANDIDMQVLPTLTEDDLREIGVKSFGVRRKLRIVCEEMTKLEALLVPDTDGDSGSTVSSQDDSMETLDDDDVCLARLATRPSTSTPKRHMLPPNPRIVKSSSSVDIVVPYNLKKVLEDHSEGEKVDDHLAKGGVPSSQQRRTLVRLAVACMVDNYGLYPSSKQKTALAKEIVKTYPSTMDTTPGMKGHEHFYDNGHGFIEYRLKNMRTARPQEEKRRQRSSKSKQLSCPRAIPGKLSSPSSSKEAAQNDSIGEKVNWMKYMPPTHDNHAKHRQYLKDTFQHRRAIVEGPSSLTVTDILQQFPRFQDMPELINMEFQMMFPEKCDNFVTKWEASFTEKIIALGQAEYPAIQGLIERFEDGNRNICALSALTYMLHRSEGTDAGEAAKKKDERFKQPFILSLGPERRPKQFFIVLDRIAVSGGLNVVDAVDRLFKCHYVFNVEYCPCLQQFWEFIASMIYEILPPCQAKPQVRALGAAIRAPTKQ
ncbi:hypothetical protein HOLleu_14068 [Holothuria leucospilota]|uniref:Uncharacterized protein n=1 Tax=Holothuria leucospilota TaxID=206669 RepID=A0A9Q1HBH4_HOLLE|nr:hypothetical protein HOLleu_14068 [Holothuria leucospilota]